MPADGWAADRLDHGGDVHTESQRQYGAWAVEAETLWAAVSARKPRLESRGADLRRTSFADEDATTRGDARTNNWPTARLFPATTSTPVGETLVAGVATVTSMGTDPQDCLPIRSQSSRNLTHDDCVPTQSRSPINSPWSVSDWRTSAANSRTHELAARRTRTETHAKQVAWHQLEREYKLESQSGPLRGTPLALARLDAKALRVGNLEFGTQSFGMQPVPRDEHTSRFSFVDWNCELIGTATWNQNKRGHPSANQPPLPRALVKLVFRAWRTHSAARRRFRRVTRRKRETLTRTTFAEWRDESYVNKTHRVVRKAAAFEIWRSVVATTNVVAEVTRVVRAVSLKKNAAGTFAVWRVLAAACSKLLLAATKVSCLRRTKTVLKKWKQQTTERRRDKSWCAFSSVWHGRRAVTKTFQKWDTLAGYLKQARRRATEIRDEKRFKKFAAVFLVWRRKAGMLSAGRDLVNLAVRKWRHDLTQHVFDAFFETAARTRNSREKSEAFYKVNLAKKYLRRWFQIARNVRRLLYDDAVAAMSAVVGNIRKRLCIDRWRLVVFRAREHDRRVTKKFFHSVLEKSFEEWRKNARAGSVLANQLVEETNLLGWPFRVRMRHSITTWSERAFSRRSHRHSVAIDVVLVARRNRQRRALQRWHLNVSESELEKLQNNAATRHWLFFVFKLFRGEIARRQESRIQTLNKLGFAALRRLVTCYCGWRSLVRETRAIKRRVKRCRDTTRAGHFLETGGHTRRNVFLHKESIDNKKLAERARKIRETRDLEDTACLGPIVCVAARARTRQILLETRRPENHARAEELKKRLGEVWQTMVATDTARCLFATGFNTHHMELPFREKVGAGEFVPFANDFENAFSNPKPSAATPSVKFVTTKPPVAPKGFVEGFPTRFERSERLSASAHSAQSGKNTAQSGKNTVRSGEYATTQSENYSNVSSAVSTPNGSPVRSPGKRSPGKPKSISPSNTTINSPSRALSGGFRSAQSSLFSSRAPSANVSANVSMNPSPAKPGVHSQTVSLSSPDLALRLLRERLGLAKRPGNENGGSPSAVSWSPARASRVPQPPEPESPPESPVAQLEASTHSPGQPRRQTSSKIFEMQARVFKQ